MPARSRAGTGRNGVRAPAALPLVLDPLIGTLLHFRQANDDGYTDVAYDETQDVHLVVWERTFSINDSDIRGQAVTPNGELRGGLVLIRNTFNVSIDPRVGNVGPRSSFVVVWREGLTILAAGVGAGSGTPSAAVTVASGYVADVAHEDADSDAIVVWNDTTRGMLRAARIRVSSTGSLSIFDYTDIGPAGLTGVAISPQGTGRRRAPAERTCSRARSGRTTAGREGPAPRRPECDPAREHAPFSAFLGGYLPGQGRTRTSNAVEVSASRSRTSVPDR